KPVLKAAGEYLRMSHMLMAKKKIAKAASNKNEVGRPVSVSGILKISAPVAASVSSRAITTDKIDAVMTASAMARMSTSRTNGQTMKETSARCRIGTSTSAKASGGKIWLPQSAVVTPRRRCSTTGNTAWTTAKMK